MIFHRCVHRWGKHNLHGANQLVFFFKQILLIFDNKIGIFLFNVNSTNFTLKSTLFHGKEEEFLFSNLFLIFTFEMVEVFNCYFCT